MIIANKRKIIITPKASYLTWALIILFASLIVATILLASVPPVDRDSLTHHLYVPKLYLKHGGIYEIPEIFFSYYPMNLDLLYMIPLYFGNDIIPKYIHYFFALLTSCLIYKYLKSRTSLIYALLGSLFLLSIPIIIKLSITAYVDLGLMFFSTASLLLIFRWLNSDYKIRYLTLAGCCCGLATGVKYNGIVTLVILVLILPLLYIRTNKRAPGSDRKSLGYCIIFMIMTLLAFSPWLIRNYLWTDNPIYPLHDSFFNSSPNLELTTNETSSVSTESSGNVSNPFVSRKILYHETWWQTSLLPIRFFFEGQDDNPQFFDGKLNPFLLFLPMLAFLRKSSSPSLRLEKKALLIFAFLFFFFTFFQQVTRIRYIICIIPPLVILSIFGLQNLFTFITRIHSINLKKFATICTCIIPAAFLGYNLTYLVKQFHIIQPLPYLSGKISRDQYISHFRPEYPAIQFINKLPQPTKTLAIFLGNRGYYFNTPVQFDSQNNKNLIWELLQQATTEDELFRALRKKGITHILIRYDFFEQRLQQYLNPEEIKRLYIFFQNRTHLTYNANGHGVFQII